MHPTRLSVVSVLTAVTWYSPTLAQSTRSVTPMLRTAGLTLDLTVDYQAARLEGSASVDVENAGEQPAGELSLLLGRLMVASAVTDTAGQPLAFRQAVVIFTDDAARQVNQLLVPLDPPLPPHGRRTVRVRYGGVLVGYTETGSLYIRDHVDPEFTVVREDAYAFPVIGVPSSAANRAVPRADFPYEATLTVPVDQTVANGGELIRHATAGALVRWTYRSRGAAPFLNLTVAPYQRLTDQGATVFAFPRDAEGGAHVLERSRRAVELFTRWLGPPPAAPQFSVIEIPAGFGSQASLVAGIIQEADVFQPGAGMQPLYHEVSHFWNTPDAPDSCRWNEGLAMYLQRRAAAALDGWTGLHEDLERRTTRLRDLGAKEPRLATVPFADYGKADMTDWSYTVGPIFFALLDRAEGERGFESLVREYQQEHRSPEPCTDFAGWIRARGTPAAVALAHEWFETPLWWSRIAAGATFDQLASGRAPSAPQNEPH